MDKIINDTNALQTVAQVRELFTYWIAKEQLNFHPDTPMQEYINRESGSPVFDAEKATRYNEWLDRCFYICKSEGADIYALALDCFRQVHPDLFV